MDKDKSGSSHVSRREVELSPVVPQPPERRTITIIQSPPRPAGSDDSTGVTGPTDSAEVADSAGVTARRTPQQTMTQQLMSWQETMTQQVTSQPRKRTRQVLLTRQFSRTQQGMPVTAQQGMPGLLPRVPQQGRLELEVSHQINNEILPWFRRPAACCFCLFQNRSTRPAYLTLCQCGLSCNVGWTEGCQFQTLSPGPLLRHLHPEMTRLLPEDLGLQVDDPGGWMSPGAPPGPGLPSEDHHLQILLPGMLLQSISRPTLTQPRM